MTETPRPPKTLTSARLKPELIERYRVCLSMEPYIIGKLISHIDALTAEVAALRTARADALNEAEARIVYNLAVDPLEVRALFQTVREAPLSKEPSR